MEIYDKLLEISPNNFGALQSKAYSLSRSEKYHEAMEIYDKLLEIKPNDVGALKSKSICLTKLKKYHEAMEIYDKLLEISPNNFGALKSKAYSLGNLNKYPEAMEIHDKLLEINPNDVEVLKTKAYCLTKLNKYPEAMEIHDKLLEINPNDVGILQSKAYSLTTSEKYPEAMEIYDKLLEIKPDDAKILQSKSICLTKLKKYPEAMEIYDKLLEINPNDAKILQSKAYALYYSKQFLLAIPLIEKILDDPNAVDVTFCNIYAKILKKNFSNEDPTNFITSKINSNKYNLSWFMVLIKFQIISNNLSDIIKIYENNPELLKESIFLTQLGYVYELQNNPDNAIRYFTLALEKDPLNDWARFSRGQCNIECKLYDLALEDFEIGFINSKKIHHKESYAYVLDILGRFDESISILSQYENSYRRLNVLKVLGLIYRNNRKYGESLDCYLQILQENENDPNGLIGCALVYESKSEYDLALKNIEKSLEQNGYDEFTMKIKVEILIKMNDFEEAQKNLTLMQQNKSTTLNSKIDSNSEYSSYIKSAVLEELEKINSTSLINNIDDRSLEIKNLYNLTLAQIFKNTESDILEYKSTLRYDLELKQSNKELELEVLQTICAFLNTHGGILVVGYNDDENYVCGLEKDYQTMGKRKDWDGWQQKLENLIENSIGTTYSAFISMSKDIFYDNDEQKDVAKIKVQKSSRSAYLKMNNSNVFFARRNGQSNKLDSKETQEWIKDHNLG